MNTKKLAVIFTILIFVYFGLQVSINFFKHGHHVTYNLKEDEKVVVDEVYVRNIKNEQDNYFLKITINNLEFSLQLYNDFKKHNYIIRSVKYYEDSKYKCIYPIFKNKKQYTDFICFDGNIYYNYNDIKGRDDDLDKFVSSIEEYQTFNDNLKEGSIDNVSVFNGNLITNHFLALENYKGIYLINKNIKENIKLFNNDIYTKTVHYFSNNNYLVADYDSDYTFNDIYIVNIKDGKKTKIKSNKSISFDSYTMGSKNLEVYFLDKSNKKQYKVDVNNKDLYLVDNNDEIISYENGTKENVNIYKAIASDITFNEYTIDNIYEGKAYYRVDKIGNKLSGYYYLYEKDKSNYKIYRSNIQDTKKITYIGTTSNANNVFYIDDYLYFKNGDTIYYYNDRTGIKKVIKYNELKYNNSLMFGVASK